MKSLAVSRSVRPRRTVVAGAVALALIAPHLSLAADADAVPAGDSAVATSKDEEKAKAEEEGIETLTVTAQRREQSIQEVPISMSGYSETMTRDIGASNINDLGRFTPGMETNNTSVTQPRYTLRGITTNDFGIGSDPAVAVYVDGVYIGRGGAAQFNFNDIERVEILKGPQGTLFGRNAAAGAIQVVTHKPSAETEGAVRVTAGNYDRQKLEGMFNTALSDNLYFRMSVMSDRRDGYYDRVDGGSEGNLDDQGARASLLWDAGMNTEVILRAEYDHVDQDARQVAGLNESIAPGDPFGDIATDVDSNERRHLAGYSLEVNHDFESSRFTSLTAYRRFDSTNYEEEDGSAEPRFYFASSDIEDQQQWSQEFRLTSTGSGPLKWTLGANWNREKIDQSSVVNITTDTLDTFFLEAGGVPPEFVTSVPLGMGLAGFALTGFADQLAMLSNATGIAPEDLAMMIAQANLGRPWTESVNDKGDYDSWAVYADATWEVTDKFNLTFGMRYTWDSKDFTIHTRYDNAFIIPIPGVDPVPFGLVFAEQIDPSVKRSDDWNAFTPRFVADYHFTDDLMTYFSAAKGFKAGGFNSFGLDPAFNEENVVNYEVGMKSDWLDHRLRLNASVFHYDYTDLQILKLSGPADQLPTYNVGNADAKGDGFEMELTWLPLDELTISANYGYLDTEYTDYTLFPGEGPEDDLTGKPLSSMPKNKVNLSAQYVWTFAGGSDLAARVDYTWVDDRVESSGLDPNRRIDSYNLTNARLSWRDPSQHWEVAGYATNLFDEEYLLGVGGQGEAIGSPTASRGEPRMVGVEVSYQF